MQANDLTGWIKDGISILVTISAVAVLWGRLTKSQEFLMSNMTDIKNKIDGLPLTYVNKDLLVEWQKRIDERDLFMRSLLSDIKDDIKENRK
jgi:hypothetical protein